MKGLEVTLKGSCDRHGRSTKGECGASLNGMMIRYKNMDNS